MWRIWTAWQFVNVMWALNVITKHENMKCVTFRRILFCILVGYKFICHELRYSLQDIFIPHTFSCYTNSHIFKFKFLSRTILGGPSAFPPVTSVTYMSHRRHWISLSILVRNVHSSASVITRTLFVRFVLRAAKSQMSEKNQLKCEQLLNT